jgi:hypothetical protein
MCRWHDDPHAHAAVLYRTVMTATGALRAGNAGLVRMLAAQKAYAGFRYGQDRCVALGEPFVRGIAGSPLGGYRRHGRGE